MSYANVLKEMTAKKEAMDSRKAMDREKIAGVIARSWVKTGLWGCRTLHRPIQDLALDKAEAILKGLKAIEGKKGVYSPGRGTPVSGEHGPFTAPFFVSNESAHLSAESILWTRAGKINKAFQKMVDTLPLNDFEKLGVFNCLHKVENKAPIFLRDRVLGLAWERYQKNGGSKTIVHEISSIFWLIRHGRIYGHGVGFILDDLEGVLKTNVSIAQFSSTNIDDMLNNNDDIIDYELEYGFKQSDYSCDTGESANPANSNNDSITTLSLQEYFRSSISGYLTGLPVKTVSALELYLDKGFLVFVKGGMNDVCFKNVDGVLRNFTSRLFSGYLKHEGIKKNDSLLGKRDFLTYVYDIRRGLGESGINVNFVNSINLEKARLSPMPSKKSVELIKAEKEKKYFPTFSDYAAAAEPESQYKTGNAHSITIKRRLIDFKHN
jgi:hypothetical protein